MPAFSTRHLPGAFATSSLRANLPGCGGRSYSQLPLAPSWWPLACCCLLPLTGTTSPTQRFLLVLAMIAGFHLAGGALLPRLRPLGLALHAVGTVALGRHFSGGTDLQSRGTLAGRHPPVGDRRCALVAGATRLAPGHAQRAAHPRVGCLGVERAGATLQSAWIACWFSSSRCWRLPI